MAGISYTSFPYNSGIRTACELPGSFTVENCSSLYFLKAGSRELIMEGSLLVMDLIASETPRLA